MKFSVIIPCLNAARTIGAQLEALADQHCDELWEVIVSDNGSTDQSLEIVNGFRNRLPTVSIVDASDRRGAAHARNVGARTARGESLLFCDADDEVAPGWLSAMADALSKYDFVACRVDFGKLNEPWMKSMFQDHQQTRGLQKASYAPYLEHAGGGTLGVKKYVHESVGGFDESLTAHEDTDYCFRIQLSGVKLHFETTALLNIRCRNMLSGAFRQASLWAEQTVFLSRKYQPCKSNDGVEWRSFVKAGRRLLLSAPQLRSRIGRALWVWDLGWQVGRLKGSFKY
jgi:glycosyltransferase involved in cell wall biosynthesis